MLQNILDPFSTFCRSSSHHPRRSTCVTLSCPPPKKLAGLGTFVIIFLDLHMVLRMCHSKCYNKLEHHQAFTSFCRDRDGRARVSPIMSTRTFITNRSWDGDEILPRGSTYAVDWNITITLRLNPISSVNRTRDRKQKELPAIFFRRHW